MARCEVNGLTIEYEAIGNPAAAPILLVMGLGAQLTFWPDEFCHGLAERGFRVIRYDNRDVGLSSKLAEAGIPDIGAALALLAEGRQPEAPYTLDDMAADAVGLLDALQVRRAHVVGLSMGGMIAQILAARHAPRVASLVSIMSSSGARGLPHATPEAMQAILARPTGDDLAALVRHAMGVQRVIGSPRYPMPEDYLRQHVARNIERSYYPPGYLRQYAAILAAGSRVDLLHTIEAPTLVIHGVDDPLVPVAAGRDTAQRVPGATLQEIEGMGHDLPPALLPRLIEAIAGHCRSD